MPAQYRLYLWRHLGPGIQWVELSPCAGVVTKGLLDVKRGFRGFRKPAERHIIDAIRSRCYLVGCDSNVSASIIGLFGGASSRRREFCSTRMVRTPPMKLIS